MSSSPAGAGFEDLTARARIRNAALEQFAGSGFASATIREIARAAGVSPGLVRHHFGSKDDLRRACDEYALASLRAYGEHAMSAEGLNDPATVGAGRYAAHPYMQYLARALVDSSPAAAQIFDQMTGMTEQFLRRTDAGRDDQPFADARTRAALMVAMSLGVPAFQEHISRSIGADITTPEGDRRVVLAALDIQSHPAITPETARTLRAGLDGAAG